MKTTSLLGTYGATALTPAYLPALAARTARVTRTRATPRKTVSRSAVKAAAARKAAVLAGRAPFKAPRGLNPKTLGVTVTPTGASRYTVATPSGRTFRGLTPAAVVNYLRAVKRAGTA